MLEELRQFNAIGNLEGIEYFSQIVLVQDKIQKSSVAKLCGLRNNICLNTGAAIAYYKYVGLIEEENGYLNATEIGIKLKKSNDFGYEFCKICFSIIIDAEMLDLNAVHYSRSENLYYIERFGFSVSAALFRNILIQYRAISEKKSILIISKNFESLFADYQRKNRLQKSVEKLKEQLEQQEIQGEKAELFVVEYEKNRLNEYSKSALIKRISVVDVAAGYDIVSFEQSDSDEYDRFIEVKSYFGNPHFYWSQNEINTSKLYSEKYYIYLVDASKINDSEYVPYIIKNPVDEIIGSEKWLMSPTSFMVIPTE